MKYVPELEEERFQSMVAVPILARAGDVIGVVVLHTEAPREFDEDVLNFLVHTASLVGGAIENAQLFEETRRRVDALTTLTQLSQSLAAVTLREDLYDAVTRGARQLLGADACQIWRLDADADELVLAGSDPPDAPEATPRPGRAALLLDLMRREKGGRRAPGPSRRTTTASWSRRSWPATSSSASSPASSAAAASPRTTRSCSARWPTRPRSGLKKAALIERLTAENIVKDMFEALAAGLGRDRRGEGRRRPLRPQPPAPVPPRRARARAARTARRGPSSPRASRRGSSGSTRARSSTPATTGCARWCRCPPTRPDDELWRVVDELAREEGLNVGRERRGPRRGERAPAPARGGRRREHRALAGGGRRRGLLRAARAPTATSCTSSSTRRRTTATARPWTS